MAPIVLSAIFVVVMRVFVGEPQGGAVGKALTAVIVLTACGIIGSCLYNKALIREADERLKGE